MRQARRKSDVHRSGVFGRIVGTGLFFASMCSGVLAADPKGVWVTQDKDAAVAIDECGDDWSSLCGRIVWLRDAIDESGNLRLDSHNPDPARRSRPICGLVVIGGLRPSGQDSWDSGSVYNPQDGQIYSSDMTLLAATTMRVRAYIGVPFFGKSQIWTRAERSAASLIEYNCRDVRIPPAVPGRSLR